MLNQIGASVSLLQPTASLFWCQLRSFNCLEEGEDAEDVGGEQILVALERVAVLDQAEFLALVQFLYVTEQQVGHLLLEPSHLFDFKDLGFFKEDQVLVQNGADCVLDEAGVLAEPVVGHSLELLGQWLGLLLLFDFELSLLLSRLFLVLLGAHDRLQAL